MNHHRSAAAATVLAAVAVLLTACSGSSETTDSTTSASASSSKPSSRPAVTTSTAPPRSVAPTTSKPSTTSPRQDPRGKAATAAYLAFVSASNDAERKPTDQSRVAAIKAHTVDPALAEEGENLFQFREQNIEWRGTPPASRVQVKAVDASGTRPTVTIIDCPTISNTWRPYDASTGRPLKLVAPKVPPPWATTATVIYYRGRWMVQTAKVNMSRTCAP